MTSRRRFLAAFGASAATLAGCGYRPGGGDIRWRREDEAVVTGVDRVAAVGGRLYALDHETTLVAPLSTDSTLGSTLDGIDLDDGSRTLARTYETPMSCSAVDDGGVATCRDGTLHRLGNDGEEIEVDLPATAAGMALADGVAYVRTTESLVAVALSDRRVEWSLPLPETESATVAARAGLVLAGDESGLVAAGTDGSERWRRTDVAPETLTLAAGGAYVSTRGRLIALDPASGETRWSSRAADGPVVTAEGVFYGESGGLVAVDHAGDVRWRYDGLATGRFGAAADERGVFVESETGLAAIADGDPRWEVAYDRLTAGPFLTTVGVVAASRNYLLCHEP